MGLEVVPLAKNLGIEEMLDLEEVEMEMEMGLGDWTGK